MYKRIGAVLLVLALLIPLFTLDVVAAEKMGVKRIEDEAFSGDVTLKTVTLDADLTYIGAHAFEGCSGLLTVYCYSSDAVIADDAFDGVTEATVYCNLDSTMDSFARSKGMTVQYLNAFETECDTEEDEACVLLPITWSVVNPMPGHDVESTYLYEIYKEGNDTPVYTASTAATSLSYTPTEAGEYYVDITIKNELTQTKLATKKLQVKDRFYMGTYGGEKIEWGVLAVEGNRALVITINVLKNNSYFNPSWIKYKYTYWSGSYIGNFSTNYRGSQPEHPSRLITGITPTHVPLANGNWGKESDLFPLHARYWCNNTFYNSAFSTAEKQRIIRVTNKNPNNPNSNVAGGPDTNDYVFFLSYQEVAKYMPTAAARKCGMSNAGKAELNSNTENNWWLRTPGKYRVNAMYVNGKTGTIFYSGSDVGHKSIGYRPAMWVKIGK